MDREKIIIVGGGISGIFVAIFLRKEHPNYEIHIFEHSDKLFKKLNVTGNGKCNFGNFGDLTDKYNDKSAIEIVQNFNAKKIVALFDELGIKSKTIGNLIYPYSETATTVSMKLLNYLETHDIHIHLNEELISYDDKNIKFSSLSLNYEKIYFALGGKASPKLGSNGSAYNILKDHGYKFNEILPSLCPIKIKENVHLLSGIRAKATISLYIGNKFIAKEEGELLFKDDGLSGIAVFNLSSFIRKRENNIKFVIDFVPNEKIKREDFNSYLHPKIANYLLSHNYDIHSLTFTFKDFYPFDNAQVSKGGISFLNLNENLSSKIEKNVFFVGELIDIDGLCGGFNIMWAIASAYKATRKV